MKKIDWMRKLTSRKLWMSVASFVTLMIVACGGTENEATQISARPCLRRNLRKKRRALTQKRTL